MGRAAQGLAGQSKPAVKPFYPRADGEPASTVLFYDEKMVL